MTRLLTSTLVVAALLLACSKEPAAPKVKAATKPPAAPATTAKPAQDAPKPEPKPEPKPAPAEPTPAPAQTPPAEPASTPATASSEDSMYGPQNLLDAKNPKVNEKAPDTFKAKFETGKGSFVIEVTRAWSPNGADRFYNLVHNGFFDGVKFFRVVDGFMVQFGIHGDPKVSAAWRNATIKDDPVTQKNVRGMVTFAKTGAPNSRSTQLFINFVDRNTFLDSQGFSPFGKVIEGMDVVDKLYKAYGETPSQAQMQIQMEGNAFLEKNFPELDSITKATIVP
jgi:peptidyl-prolyl cis-trans isomerase A (cyclophilin A)